MLVTGQEWTSPDGRAAVRVIEMSSERSVIERLLRPNSGKAAAHVHRDWTQRFEIVEGETRIQVGEEASRLLAAGETVAIPPGVGHVDPWNESDTPAVTRNIISPVTPFVHVVFATLGKASPPANWTLRISSRSSRWQRQCMRGMETAGASSLRSRSSVWPFRR